MKEYTREQKEEALNKLPRPVSDFLRSETITRIYVGIGKKLKLNLRQLKLMSDAVNPILLGLTPEHELETNLHMLMPELSNALMREMIADLNDRVFKEIQRRMREDVVDEVFNWNESVLGPKPTKEDYQQWEAQEKLEDAHPLSDEELQKLVIEESKQHVVEEEASVAETSQTEKIPVVPATESSHEITGEMPNIPLSEQGQMAAPRDIREMEEGPVDVHAASEMPHMEHETYDIEQGEKNPPSLPSVSKEKLANTAPAVPPTEGTAPQSVSTTKLSAPTINKPQQVTDPYRETPE